MRRRHKLGPDGLPIFNDQRPKFYNEYKVEFNSQTPKIVAKMLSMNGLNIQHVSPEFRTDENNIVALKQNGLAIQFMDTTDEIYQYHAILQNGNSIQFMDVDSVPPELIEDAVRLNPFCIDFIDTPSERLCLIAIEKDSTIISSLKQTPFLTSVACDINAKNCFRIDDPDERQLAIKLASLYGDLH